MHPRPGDDERLRESRIAVGNGILEPRPVRSARLLKQAEEACRQILAQRFNGTVALKRAEVLLNTEEHVHPRPGAGKRRDGR